MNWIELWAKLEVIGTFIGLGAFIIYLICIIIDRKKEQELRKKEQELQRKDNIINELKKWLEVKEEKETIGTFSDILDKINELEGDNK